ncbi:serine hydrolase domain-containing protein [Poritiphilus flavus]|uniref:Serine hydrolase n=1 Tax=Poritiphilus flavus TaxID=2697053 RepID=A0A6L9EBS3_9FLAO|nr:serine hydrolase domain-containing protein [Poritiphilus flavus]NAS12160.1 serine hydrolase [Poritiphilus flavus]
MKNGLILVLFAFMTISGCNTATQNESTAYDDRIDGIFTGFDDANKPGAAVAVVKDGEIVFKKGYGSANMEYDIPVTPSTVFHIASVSKQFTVFAILLLAEEGKLNFDDDIRKHIPEVPDFGKTITLRHLAAHTSGLRDQWNLLALAGWRLDDVITKEHVMKLVAAQNELNFDPGEEFTYSNTGFTLLAETVARVSGQSFAEFTKARVFDPLGMSSTLFYDDHEKIVKNRSYSYYNTGNGYKKSVLSYANVGATSLFTTVEDLSLWAMNFETPKVGSKEIIEQMNTLAQLNNGETFGGAYGQFVGDYKGLKQIQHGGADAGYRTYLARFPDQKFAVAVFSNYADANPGALALRVADVFLGDQMTTEQQEQAAIPDFITLSEEDMGSFAGSYWNESGVYARKIYFKNDTLRYFRGENNESPLMPIDQNTFQMLNVEVDLKVKFEEKGDKKTMIVTIDNGDPIVSEQFEPLDYSRADLAGFTGVFYSDELSTAYTLIMRNDSLIATHPRHSDFSLTPIKEDMFSADRWYFGNVRFERNLDNSISGFRVSSGRVRNLLFEKEED